MNWEKNEDELNFFMLTASTALTLKLVLKLFQPFFQPQRGQQHQWQKCWKKKNMYLLFWHQQRQQQMNWEENGSHWQNIEKFGFVCVFVYFDLHFSYFYCFLWHLFGKYWLKSKQNNEKCVQIQIFPIFCQWLVRTI